MVTYPESMEQLDVDDSEKSLRIVENYINYICERTDFAMRNMTKAVNAAGISTVEIYILLEAQAQQLATLQSTVNQISGDVTSLKTTVGGANSGLVKAVADLQTAVGDADSGLVKAVADAQSNITAINEAIGDTSTPGTIMYALDDLDRRVTALENE